MSRLALLAVLCAAMGSPAAAEDWGGFYLSRSASKVPIESPPDAAPAKRDDPKDVCLNAILEAEQAYGIPGNLLAAIGFQEAGRVVDGRMVIWPWTINAEGAGFRFDSRGEAVARVRRLKTQGIVSIDTGCLQINQRWHPDAFPTLEAAFDPAHNADYAARFLSRLRAQLGSWRAAAAAYHSRTPEYAARYLRGLDRHIAALDQRLTKARTEAEQVRNAAAFSDPGASQGARISAAQHSDATPTEHTAHNRSERPSGAIWGSSMNGQHNSSAESLFAVSRAKPLVAFKASPLY